MNFIQEKAEAMAKVDGILAKIKSIRNFMQGSTTKLDGLEAELLEQKKKLENLI